MRSLQIINGPGKTGLIDAFKYACDKGAKLPLVFTVGIGTTAPEGMPGAAIVGKKLTAVRILGIQYKDGSGKSFNLDGICSVRDIPWDIPEARNGMAIFRANYHTENRRGTLEFI